MVDDQSRAEASRVSVGPQLTLASVAELGRRILGCLEGGSEVTLDLSAVREVDVGGLQLLCAARRSAADRGVRLRVEGAGDEVTAALRLAGISPPGSGPGSSPATEAGDG